MKAITLRNLPPHLARLIRRKPTAERLSLNRTVIRLLEESAASNECNKDAPYHDLDHLAGSWSIGSRRASIVAGDSHMAFRHTRILHTLRLAGTPITANDMWIAASAMQHRLRVLTTGEHYKRVADIPVYLFQSGAHS